jgi:hypothetical protein
MNPTIQPGFAGDTPRSCLAASLLLRYIPRSTQELDGVENSTQNEMTIYCKICGQKFGSDKPDCQKDVLTQMSNHLGNHQEQAVSLAKAVIQCSQLVATYLLIKRCVRIPPTEKELLQSVRENEACLIEIFGMELAKEETSN